LPFFVSVDPLTGRPDGTRVASPLDDMDKAILDALIDDGRASHREIAERTGISLATVNRRVRSLEDRGVIQGYTALIDPEAAGWHLNAIIGLRIDKGHLRTVQQAMAKDPRVYGVYDVTGEWDGVLLARLQDRRDLDDLAKTTLSKPHVQRTNTMVVLETVLEQRRVRAPETAKKAAKSR
jgi:DNA-binding Lrp family transcriptional regulator